MQNMIYLDNAATTYPKPEAVYVAMDSFYRSHGVNPGRSGTDLAREAGDMIVDTRRGLHEFFGNPHPDFNRLIFCANATGALNTAIQGVCRQGDHVISTRLEHNSVLRPLWEMTQAGLITHTLVSFDSDGYVDPADIAAQIRPETRLIVLNHASNVIGTVQDAAAVGAICREHGILFLLDVSQTAGVVNIDMEAMGIDLVAFTGHKSLLGPTGTGGLAVGPDVQIEPYRWGGTGVYSAVKGQPREFPYTLEAGTLNTCGIAGLKAGLEWVQERGIEAIHAHERRLCERLLKGLHEIEGIKTWCAGSDDRHVAVVSVTIGGMDSEEIGMRLDVDHDVIIRTGLQCAPLVHEEIDTVANHGTARMGIGPFSTESDIDHTLAAFREFAHVATRR